MDTQNTPPAAPLAEPEAANPETQTADVLQQFYTRVTEVNWLAQQQPDLIEVAEEKVRLRFVRKTGIPNPNFYDVLVDKRNIGYCCLPPNSARWCGVIKFGKDERQHFDTFPEVQAFFYAHIYELVAG